MVGFGAKMDRFSDMILGNKNGIPNSAKLAWESEGLGGARMGAKINKSYLAGRNGNR